jgi:hypothetical protein
MRIEAIKPGGFGTLRDTPGSTAERNIGGVRWTASFIWLG